MAGAPEDREAAAAPAAELVLDSLADRDARNPFHRYLMHLGVPLGVSLALHLLLVGLLAVKVFDVAASPAPVGEWTGAIVDADQADSPFQWGGERLLEAPAEAPLPALDALADLTRSADVDLRALAAPEAPADGAGGGGAGDGLGVGEGALSLLGTGGGAGEAGSGGFGAGLGGGGARIGEAGVWDLRFRANKIVFVVDYSGSIITAVDDLKRELKRAVGALRPSQAFSVILFYSEREAARTDVFKPKLEPATDATRREFLQWIASKPPQGDTHPLDAIRRAIAMQPEAIVFLSDGLFEDGIPAEIATANAKVKAKFYCLVFDELFLSERSGLAAKDNEGSLRMKRIAEQSGGQAKIVTAKDLAK